MNRAPAVLLALIALGGCASTPARTSSPAPAAGYLDAAGLAALMARVPPPPVAGSATDRADKAVSERYRVLEGGDRWLLATAHAELRPALALAHFDCALGTRMGSAATPLLTALFEKVLHDANEAAESVKARSFRARPVGDDPARQACQRLSEAGRTSPSYPSGSAAVGAAYGEVLAVLAPDRATETRRIGHEIAVSRIVCGMHYPSDVEAGESLGRDVAREIVATPGFEADRVAAQAELASARAAGRSNPGCAAERAALAAPLP
ncbi:phosphatase PAP2 family protein [Brevundimonas variabilis]|uniref:Acid phosphatase n=1 Tax=Brevundimonas variabilis TaxID=74312 RepID=A0A7W9CK88_9CAUL|nr:acid phosphatase (class A) [Brevundimonas variabilis]